MLNVFDVISQQTQTCVQRRHNVLDAGATLYNAIQMLFIYFNICISPMGLGTYRNVFKCEM